MAGPLAVLVGALAMAAAPLVAVLLAAPAATAAGTSSGPPPLHFGVVDGNLLSETPDQINADLDTQASLGVTYIREQLSWAALEPEPGVYRWSQMDAIVSGIAAHHMHLLALIDFTPGWAQPVGCNSFKCAPADPSRFAAFAAAAAARYSPYGVHDWEVWNEPNLVNFWLPTPDPNAYSKLLALTAAAIRSADPQAFIISGGLAPTADLDGNIDQLSYLQSLCSDGSLSVADAVGVHPYSAPVGPDYYASWNAWSQLAQTATSDRSIMAGCGAGSKPLWATEYGAPTNGPGAMATESNLDLAAHPDHVDEAFQAQMATQAVQYASAQNWFGALFWYSSQDLGTATTTNQNFYGLVRYDGTHKPAFAAYAAAISQEKSRPR
ncbi:MAG: GH39 family glycosyl hydrolase [Acidimicrobiales bacterium]